MKEQENENISFEFDNNNKNKNNYVILNNNYNNNILNTQNFFQININQNIPYERELILFNNYQNQNNSFNSQNQNQKIMSQLTLQDLLAIESLYTDTDIQKIENNCHYLQKKISANPVYANDVLFPFLFSNIVSLINDQFGNFIYQGFIDILNSQNLINLLFIIKNNFFEISKSQNGTRVIQKLLEKTTLIKQGNNNLIQKTFIEILEGKVCECSNDEHANHIIQKFILNIPFPYNNFIYDELYQNFMNVVITKYGCCVIQKCILNGTKEQKDKLIYLVLQNTFHLIRNQFGNYVFQCVLFLRYESVNLKIIEIIYEKIVPLCKEKYSSNVIEKIFEINNPNVVNQLIDYISQSENKVMELLTNKYGNYIIQKILSICQDKNLFYRILNIIAKNISTINKISFGKKLLSKLEEKYPILTNMIKSNN
jgi:hypothetical protein